MVSTRLAENYRWWRGAPPKVGEVPWSEMKWTMRGSDGEGFATRAARSLTEEGCIVLGVDARNAVASATHADDIYAVARSRNIHPVVITAGNPLDWAAYGFDVEYVPEDAPEVLEQALALWAAEGAIPLDTLVNAARLLPTGEAPGRR